MSAPLPSKVESRIQRLPDGCWLWTGSVSVYGYGRLYWQGRQVPSHRVVYELLIGPIPDGLHIDHLCRVRACCNPSHLEPVTAQENNRRAAAVITHCAKGHEFTPENTLRTWRGVRKCRTCNRDWNAKRTAVQSARRELACDKGHPRTPEYATRRSNGGWFCHACCRATKAAA